MFEKTFLFSSRIKWKATGCRYLYNGRIPSKDYIISVCVYYKYQIITSLLLANCIVSFLLMTMSKWNFSDNFISPVSWSHSRVKFVQIILIDKVNSTNVRSSNSAFESRSSSKTKQVSLLPPWVEAWKLPTTSFTPQKFPILFFSNYRHAYFTKCLESISQSAKDIDKSTACIFVLHRTTKVSNADIEKTKAVIEKVHFCRKFVWEANKDGPASVLYAANYKKHWWKTVSKIFKREGVFETALKDWDGGDLLILEEDTILSPDFMKAFWFASHVKNSVAAPISQIALGGWSGSNLVNGHPNTFVVRRTYHFQAMAYGFNSSFFQFLWKHEEKWLHDNNADFSESIGHFIRGRQLPFLAVAPTMARMWHIGAKGMGESGTGKERGVPPKPWAQTPHFLIPDKAQLNRGIRGLYGFLCPPEKVVNAGRFCPEAYQKFVNGHGFSFKCVKQDYVSDPCIE